MAAINVTSANTDDNIQIRGSRLNVRNSGGLPYVVVENETDDSIDVWKADTTTSTVYMDGSDAGASDPDAVWTDETNTDDGSTGTYGYTTTVGTSSTNYVQIEGTDAAGSGDNIVKVEMRAHNNSAWSSYDTLSVPSGGWTWAKLQALETRSWGPTINCTTAVYENGDAGGTALATVTTGLVSLRPQLSRIEFRVTTLDDPVTWTEQDTSNNPAASIYGSCSAAIDSSDIIHIGYMYDNGKTSQSRYVTFDTSTDTFSGDATVDSDIGGDPLNINRLYTSIAVDSSDIPHLVYGRYDSNMGADWVSATYNNRIGGAWNASPGTEIIGSTAEVQTAGHDLTIDADDLPVVALHINGSGGVDDVVAYLGNANDASSFTSFVVFADASYPSITSTQPQRYVSIAVDSDGNHQVAYIDIDALNSLHGDLRIRAHNYGDAWATTWQTAENIATGNLKNPSLVIDGTDRYIFCEDEDTADIVYYVDTGSGWSSATTLETGTYNNAVTKWAYWVDNDSTGALVTGGLVDSYDFSNNDADIDLTNINQDEVGQSFTGDGGSVKLVKFQITKTGSPTGDVTAALYAHTGTFGSTGTPTGSTLAVSTGVDVTTFSSDDIVAFSFPTPYETTNGTKYFVVIQHEGNASNYISLDVDATSPTHGGNLTWRVNGGSWTASSSRDAGFIVLAYARSAAAEIDYTFTDETATTDVLWNTLSLAAEPPATTPIPPQIITW